MAEDAEDAEHAEDLQRFYKITKFSKIFIIEIKIPLHTFIGISLHTYIRDKDS